VQHVFEAAVAVADLPPVLVVGAGETGVQELLGNRASYVVQAERLGTGHATQMAASVLKGQAAQVIVTYGDMPLLRAETLAQLAQKQRESSATIAMLTVMGSTDSSFGRIVRDQNGRVMEIVEVAEARRRANSAALLAIPELNVGVYCFDADWLWQHIGQLPLRQARSGSEYYLTDMVETAVRQSRRVEAIVVADADESLGAGTRAELVAVEKAFRRRANAHWLGNGVTLVDPDSIFIDPDVQIGQDTVIWPNSYLQGSTVVGNNCVIGPNAILRHAKVGDGCRVEMALVENTAVADGTVVVPFSHVQAS
jgi:bifunctional UDP-N-acetylglucosamine pyrophosphorylase/glucosamine-1-phosphate N-acetyltransferase